MNKNQFKSRAKQVNGEVKEISERLLRGKLLKKERHQKIGSRIPVGYGDFRDDIQNYNDLEDDIRGYGDFRGDLQKSD